MTVGALERIAATAMLASLTLPLSAESQAIAPTKLEVTKYTCAQFSALDDGEERDRILIYMNGYLDGTRRTATWDADQVGRRIDEVVRLCKASPKTTLLDAFKRAWNR